MRTQTRRHGFTLIEVMLVLVILAGLAGLAVFAFSGREQSTKIDMTGIRVKKLLASLNEYKLRLGTYPTEEQGGLKALVTKPTFEDEKKGERWYQFAEAAELKDFWDNDLRYELVEGESSGQVPRLSSNGPDGQEGTDDDINSWSEAEGVQ